MSTVYALPMSECSSCGRFLGHLYDDHIQLTKKLEKDLSESGGPRGSYIGEHSEIDITEFIRVYYTWSQSQGNQDKAVFKPLNIVASAFLALKPLETADLPFGTRREVDGQRTVFDHPLCCLRMFQGNPNLH
jgi:hypothetical protein